MWTGPGEGNMIRGGDELDEYGVIIIYGSPSGLSHKDTTQILPSSLG